MRLRGSSGQEGFEMSKHQPNMFSTHHKHISTQSDFFFLRVAVEKITGDLPWPRLRNSMLPTRCEGGGSRSGGSIPCDLLASHQEPKTMTARFVSPFDDDDDDDQISLHRWISI